MYCEVCMEDAKMICSACKVTRYCSAACQLEDWKVHKKGCKMNQMLNKINEEYAARPPKRPAAGRCTGCNVKFDDEENLCEGECEECGYQACESCIVDTTHGTCYCANQNFGNPYCKMAPRWYHANGRGKSYQGDRHPHPEDEYPLEAFEAEPRECKNCGEVALMLKKGSY